MKIYSNHLSYFNFSYPYIQVFFIYFVVFQAFLQSVYRFPTATSIFHKVLATLFPTFHNRYQFISFVPHWSQSGIRLFSYFPLVTISISQFIIFSTSHNRYFTFGISPLFTIRYLSIFLISTIHN